MIEIMVVVVVLGVIMSLIVPRLLGNDRREFNLTVERVADLLMMYAQRESLGQKVVGLGHDRASNTLFLMEIDTGGEAAEYADWTRDAFVDPVRLPQFMLDTDMEIRADGDFIDASEWPLSTEIGQDRPTIDITLRGAGEMATISLAPHGVSPIIYNGIASEGVIRTRVDLDGTGHGREDW